MTHKFFLFSTFNFQLVSFWDETIRLIIEESENDEDMY